MFNRVTWYSLIIISVAGFVALSLGFFKSLQVTGNSTAASELATTSETAETSVEANTSGTSITSTTSKADGNPVSSSNLANSLQIVVMGDSIAHGTGDEKGRGFSTYLPDYLKNQTAKDLAVENIGIDGLKSAGLLEQVKNPQLQPLMAAANLFIISIGGNDLRSLRSQNELTKTEEFQTLEDIYLNNLQEIMGTIRQSNSKACIVFIGLYNPYENSPTSYQDTKLLSQWNNDTQMLIEGDAKAIFIPTYDIFKYNLNRFVAPDGLHPNSSGYQVVANRIGKSIENLFNGD